MLINEEMLKVDEVDWDHWQPDMVATLLFVIVKERILLIRKKRGLGAGKINGPGGRLEENETPLECAIRETREELCITPLDVRAHGQLFFHGSSVLPHILGYVFTAGNYEGTPEETDEAIPIWTPVTKIPWDEMWEDDQYWLPLVLDGQSVDARFTFAGDNLIDHKVVITSKT